MLDAEACLKPSGVIIFIDGDTRFYLEDNVTLAPVAVDADEPGGPVEGSWFHRIARGVSISTSYTRWLTFNPRGPICFRLSGSRYRTFRDIHGRGLVGSPADRSDDGTSGKCVYPDRSLGLL